MHVVVAVVAGVVVGVDNVVAVVAVVAAVVVVVIVAENTGVGVVVMEGVDGVGAGVLNPRVVEAPRA